MNKRAVALGGAVSTLAALVAAVFVGQSAALTPWGLLAGLVVAVRVREPADGLFDGALAGTVGGVGTVCAVGLLSAVQAFVRLSDPGVAASLGVYVTFATMVIIIPLFALEGLVVGAVGASVRNHLQRRQFTRRTES